MGDIAALEAQVEERREEARRGVSFQKEDPSKMMEDSFRTILQKHENSQ